eukprot:614964-Rhodomonas_salina.3
MPKRTTQLNSSAHLALLFSTQDTPDSRAKHASRASPTSGVAPAKLRSARTSRPTLRSARRRKAANATQGSNHILGLASARSESEPALQSCVRRVLALLDFVWFVWFERFGMSGADVRVTGAGLRGRVQQA